MAVQSAGCVFTYFCGRQKNTFYLQFRSTFKEQWKYTNQVIVLYLKRIIIFKNWSDISFFQAARKDTSFKKFMQLANTENVNLLCFKIFVSISLPADLLLLKPMITCFISFTETCWNKNLIAILKFCLAVSMLGWYIPPSLVYDRRTVQEPSVHICRPSHSAMDPKYSLNVLVISLFLRMLSTFSFNIMSVYALLCLFENEDLYFTQKGFLPLAWYKGIEVF